MIDRDRDNRTTKNYIRLVVVLSLVLDTLWYLGRGGPATISTAVGDWFASSPWGWVWLGASGFLVGHLLAMMPFDSPHLFLRLSVFVALTVVGYFVTLL